MNGRWMKKHDWKVSHFVRDDQRTKWLGDEVGRSACGCTISIDEHLGAEPTGIDTCDRCAGCELRLSKLGVVS